MALKLIANYSKRLGLPGYSSHQFSVCVETEISSIDDVAGESSRLYQTLQDSVDAEIQHTGFVPEAGYGSSEQSARNVQPKGNGATNGNGSNGHTNGNDAWACSDKQQELIIKLVDEHKLDKGEIEGISRDMFGVGVKECNKLQASGLIDRILADHGGNRGGKNSRTSRPPRRQFTNGGAR